MKRAIILATAAFLTMLILVPMAMVQGAAPGGATMLSIPKSATTGFTGFAPSGPGPSGTTEFTGFAPSVGGPTPPTGGPAILLPAASVLLGSGILTYAILRRR